MEQSNNFTGSKIHLDRAQAVMDELDRLKKNGAHVLLSSMRIEVYSEFHTPVIDLVYLNPNPKAGDVYPNKQVSGTFRINKQGFMKLGNCAQIAWDPYKSGPIPSQPNQVTFQAVGGIRQPDGTLANPMVSHYTKDLDVIEQEIRFKFEAKAKDRKDLKTPEQKQEFVEYNTRNEFLPEKKFAMSKAESGAKCRVIKDILPEIKAHYTPQELSKPFVVVRIEFRPDYSDPDVKRIMLLAAANAVTGVFGQPPQLAAPTIEVPPLQTKPMAAPEIIPNPEQPPEEEPPDDDGGPLGGMTGEELDFQNATAEEQVEVLEDLVKRRGYDVSTLPEPISVFNAKNRSRFFQHLQGMNDVHVQTEDDIPF